MVGGSDFFSDMPMVELFRLEMEQQTASLSEELLNLEKDSPDLPEHLATLMRAAHSIKGAARLVERNAVVPLAHVLEDCFVQAQNEVIVFSPDQVDILLLAVDVLKSMAMDEETDEAWLLKHQAAYDKALGSLKALLGELSATPSISEGASCEASVSDVPFCQLDEHELGFESEENVKTFCPIEEESSDKFKNKVSKQERVLRVSSRQLDRLMGLTGEFMVQSRWLRPYTDTLRRLKRDHAELMLSIDGLKERLRGLQYGEQTLEELAEIQKKAVHCRDAIETRVVELESYDVKSESLSSRLQSQVIATRMRPFRDGVHGLPRIIRDVGRSLGKEIDLNMTGLDTLVDRDILERIEAPLSHLLNNAIDHGIESPEERALLGKPAKGTIKLSSFHHGGMLYILVEDDGRGIDFENLRNKVLQKGLVRESVAKNLTQQELSQFLFLPGFSTKDEVTSLSGRGVGLDVVQDVMQEMRGSIEASSKLGRGTTFRMRFPLTLSVVPSLLVEICEEAYAFPLARIDHIVRIPQSDVINREGKRFLECEGEEIELVYAASILELESKPTTLRAVSVLILSSRDVKYGYIIDRFLKESELVVQVLPGQIERIQDISAVGLMDDGMPVLIVDVDDLLNSTKLAMGSVERSALHSVSLSADHSKKRVLVVDDSITVREIERKLLLSAGYDVEVAVDGMDGWNAVRNNLFDLVVTDVDMPRLNGLQLLSMIKQDAALTSIPVIVVSYKDRPEDQERALHLGADLFIAKANFHDETFKNSVAELLGKE